VVPANQPTATGVALCREKAGSPQFKKINNRHGVGVNILHNISSLIQYIIIHVTYKTCGTAKEKLVLLLNNLCLCFLLYALC
jgi:hypothetical protein